MSLTDKIKKGFIGGMIAASMMLPVKGLAQEVKVFQDGEVKIEYVENQGQKVIRTAEYGNEKWINTDYDLDFDKVESEYGNCDFSQMDNLKSKIDNLSKKDHTIELFEATADYMICKNFDKEKNQIYQSGLMILMSDDIRKLNDNRMMSLDKVFEKYQQNQRRDEIMEKRLELTLPRYK
jgi:hypothetical protein